MANIFITGRARVLFPCYYIHPEYSATVMIIPTGNLRGARELTIVLCAYALRRFFEMNRNLHFSVLVGIRISDVKALCVLHVSLLGRISND